jgi:putative iron-regulated protein
MRVAFTDWKALAAIASIALPAAGLAQSPQWATPAALALLGAGGEGGEAGELPSSYRLDPFAAPNYSSDPKPVIESYIELVARTYGQALADARALDRAIQQLREKPSLASLNAARAAWIAARPAYLQSEVFRYYEGPIDQPARDGERAGPESQLNAWPLNEAVLDYVQGDPEAGLVQDQSVPITRANVMARDQVSDEADVTTGYHAIEFLLWGQDVRADGPGNRPLKDFVGSSPIVKRRHALLATLSGLLIDDLAFLVARWDRNDASSYAAQFAALEPVEALGRMIAGMAMLTAEELTSERLTVALDSGSQEDEHSCFSDNTFNDFRYNLRGIENVYFGRFGDWRGVGLNVLVAAQDRALDAEIEALFSAARNALDDLPQPFDAMLATPAGSPERARAEAAVDALFKLAGGIKRGGNALGVLVVAPGV